MRASLSTPHVLVAEDNIINQKLLAALLSQWGYRVSLVANGIEALGQLKEQPFQAVILDYQMPALDGLQTFQAIRASDDKTINEIPVLFLTGELSQNVLQQLEDQGVRYFLKKPIQPDLLALTLTQLLMPQSKPARQKVATTKYLSKITNGNREVMADIIGVFIEEMPGNLHRMKACCLREDWASLKKVVHKIRSNYTYMSLKNLVLILEDLELDLDRHLKPETFLTRVLVLEQKTEAAIDDLKRKRQQLLS